MKKLSPMKFQILRFKNLYYHFKQKSTLQEQCTFNIFLSWQSVRFWPSKAKVIESQSLTLIHEILEQL